MTYIKITRKYYIDNFRKTYGSYWTTDKDGSFVFSGLDNSLFVVKDYDFGKDNVIPLCARFELELASMSDDDKTVMCQEYQISEPMIHNLIRHSFKKLGLIKHPIVIIS